MVQRTAVPTVQAVYPFKRPPFILPHAAGEETGGGLNDLNRLNGLNGASPITTSLHRKWRWLIN
jgi:hypothetical protein